jgi:F-type H+-transporting ATPase subunit b
MSRTLVGERFAAAGGETHAGTAAHGGSAEGPPSLLSFDPGVGIWALIVFGALLLILRKYAWKPILDSLDARDKAIQSSLDQAARIHAENSRLTEEQNRLLAEAKAQAGQVVQTAREAAEGLKKSVETAAQEEKNRILASATQEIEAQKQSAIAELRKTTADLSIGIAEKLIRQNLDDSKNRALVDQLIQEVSRKA